MNQGNKRLILAAGFFALALDSSNSWGDLKLIPSPDAGIQDCDSSGETHSKEISSADLIAQCHDAVVSLAVGPANRWSSDGLLHAFGYHGMLFIDHLDPAKLSADGSVSVRKNVVAGTNVVFKSVQALAIDEARAEIYVLDPSTKSISVYSLNEDGDIYPRRKIISKDLEDASALTIDEKNGELIVLSSKSSALAVFGRMASSDGLKPENATTLTRKVDLSGLLASGSSLADIAASPSHSELFVLDQGSGKIVAFDRSKARPEVKRSYSVAGVVDGAQYIQYSGKGDTIRAMKSDGSGHEYSVLAPAPN